MPAGPDYYAILGVERESDLRELKRAYRVAARELHPDLPANRGDDAAAERFRQVREAYEVLSDPVRRREYDAWGRDPFGPSDLPWDEQHMSPRSSRPASAENIELSTETGSGVASIFENLFAPDPGATASAGPPPKRPSTPWSPAELDREARQDIQAEQDARGQANPRPSGGGGRRNGGPSPSPSNHRFGFNPEELAEEALRGDMAEADGFGEAETGPWDHAPSSRRSPAAKVADPPGERRSVNRGAAPRTGDELRIIVQIPFELAINGGVHFAQYRVPDSAGRWSLEDLELNVPPAMEDGGCIRLPGRGNHGLGDGARGDLLVDIAVEEHDVFRREGADLIVDVPVTPWEAASGCRLEVPTLGGKARVRVPPGVRSGQRIRLRNMGLVDPASSARGHQILVLQIQLPRKLGAAELALLEELDRRCDEDPRAAWWQDD